MVTKPVEVDLRVFERLTDTAPGEFLVASSIGILAESFESVFPLFWCEELRSCWVVIDKEIRSNSHDDGQKTLLERELATVSKMAERELTIMKIHLQPPKPATPLILAMANA